MLQLGDIQSNHRNLKKVDDMLFKDDGMGFFSFNINNNKTESKNQ